jgi:hypothetical protein
VARLVAAFVLSVAATVTAIGCTANNPSYVGPLAMGCMLGERSCSGSRPVECIPVDGGTELRNVLCPTGGTCQAGRCSPPANAAECKRDRDCAAGLVCTAFVGSGGAVSTFCVAPEGITPGALSCSAAQQCRSNLCVTTMGKGVCYMACSGDGDCPPSMKCRKYMVTVSGVQGMVDGCGPM